MLSMPPRMRFYKRPREPQRRKEKSTGTNPSLNVDFFSLLFSSLLFLSDFVFLLFLFHSVVFENIGPRKKTHMVITGAFFKISFLHLFS